MAAPKSTHILVGLGEVLWDLLPEGRKLGGAPANVAFHARSLGLESFIVSAVGNDAEGREIRRRLREWGLDCRHIHVDENHPTGTVSVAVGPDGSPSFTIREDVAWDYIPFSDDLLELAQKGDAVCYGSLAQRSDVSRATIRRFVQHSKETCLRVYDVNLRPPFYDRSIIQESLEWSNVLKLNADELRAVAGMLSIPGDEDTILQHLLIRFDLELVALTKGKDGSRLFGRAEDSKLSGTCLDVVDSVGAGDAFTAALVAGLLRELPLRTVHRHADLLASYVCTQHGAMPVLPGELKKFLGG